MNWVPHLKTLKVNENDYDDTDMLEMSDLKIMWIFKILIEVFSPVGVYFSHNILCQ